MAAPAPVRRPWQGHLELRYGPLAGRSVPLHRRHHGPLRLQRGFYPEGAVCHSYLLHPPGGVAGGDELELDVAVEDGAHALLTAPGANKFYRSAGDGARLRQRLRVGPGGVLEWLPHEQIVFNGARARIETEIELTGGARLFAWELTCLGRPAAGERYRAGCLGLALKVVRDDAPLLHERLELGADPRLLEAPWGLQGQPVLGTLLATGAGAEERDLARRVLGEQAAATLLGDLLVCRYLGPSAAAARAGFVAVWAALRPRLLGRPACPPRIWAT